MPLLCYKIRGNMRNQHAVLNSSQRRGLFQRKRALHSHVNIHTNLGLSSFQIVLGRGDGRL